MGFEAFICVTSWGTEPKEEKKPLAGEIIPKAAFYTSLFKLFDQSFYTSSELIDLCLRRMTREGNPNVWFRCLHSSLRPPSPLFNDLKLYRICRHNSRMSRNHLRNIPSTNETIHLVYFILKSFLLANLHMKRLYDPYVSFELYIRTV